jgi:hypothetical protein
MNFASKTAPVGLDAAVEGSAHPPDCWVADQPLDVRDDPAGIRLVPAPVQLLGDQAKLDDEVSG